MVNVLTMAEYLESHGYKIVKAHDGLEAIEKAVASAPAIILMDIQMPVMDGYEAARRMREDPRLASIPIVAVTSFAMTTDRAKALEMGFVGYIEKPVNPDTFAAEIEQFLPGKAARA